MNLLLRAVLGVIAITGLLVVVFRLHRSGQRTFVAYPTPKVGLGDVCPGCGAGTVRKTSGRFGDFLGCSMFNVTGCRAAWNMSGVRITGMNYGRLSYAVRVRQYDEFSAHRLPHGATPRSPR